jgi:sugar lactone lactonase YvrE
VLVFGVAILPVLLAASSALAPSSGTVKGQDKARAARVPTAEAASRTARTETSAAKFPAASSQGSSQIRGKTLTAEVVAGIHESQLPGKRSRPPGAAGASAGQTSSALNGLSQVKPPVNGNRVARERALQSGVSLTPSKTQPHWACPESSCEAIIDPPAVKMGDHWKLPEGLRALEGSGEKGGFDPADLRSAYSIPTSGGEAQQHYEEKQTIALVDVGYIPSAESNLAQYRSRYGLPLCTKASGCFRQVNEQGEEGKPPPVDEEWNLETTLDIDMASAMCPHCHILLVESTLESLADLAVSANTAARLGANEISNSYGLPEQEPVPEPEPIGCGETACQQLDSDYNHPGVVVTVSAGDAGYDNYLRSGTAPLFPAVSSTVIAVGGTSLHKTTEGRKWSESVWWEPTRSLGTGSGCSALRAKPTWQADSGCPHRTDNDVAAVAACETPVSVYSPALGGWENVCGTSVSSPLVAGIEAHANEAGGAVPTADAFYKDRSSLYDVTKGRNDTSCSAKYLCSAETQESGYDGPAGNGTPANGPVVASGEPPTVRTGPATGIKKGEARLTGVIDPNVPETSYHFEYGTTTSYGTSVPVPEASAGSGAIATEVSQTININQPATYHYRLVATNVDGTAYGQDETFSYGPAVTNVEPKTGESRGGTTVTITGTRFTEVNAVKFGSTNATSFTVKSETSITAVAPAGTGTVDVTVTTEAGTSAATTADQFTYGPTYSMSSVFFCLCIPTAVAADSKGHLFVADWYESRVQEYGETGEYLGQLGSAGSGPGQYEEPKGIAVDSKGNIWVVDEGNARAEEFNEKGGYVRSLGSPGSGPGQFQSPSAVAVDAKGDVWVADLAGSVQEFNEKGEYVAGGGAFGSGPGQFEWPTGVAVDAKGDLWVTDMFNHRVQELGEKGEYLGQFGSKGEGAGQLSYPDGVAVDSQGNVYVADLGNGRVDEFTEHGEPLATLGSFFSGPTGVTVDSKGNVWASEESAFRVERWTGTP